MADEVKNIIEKAVELSDNPDAVNEDRTHYDDETPTEPRWYVVHTYSGYENKVKEDLIKAVDNAGLSDIILDVMYPTEETIEIQPNGKRKTVTRKVYPGYVMVKMIMTDSTWYIVRNTRGVTSFVGTGNKPIPLTDEEVTAMGVERMSLKLDVEVGENVRIVNGPFANFIGSVTDINTETQKVKLLVSLFGKETPMELDFIDIQKL